MITKSDFKKESRRMKASEFYTLARNMYGYNSMIFKANIVGDKTKAIVGFVEYDVNIIPVVAVYPEELYDPDYQSDEIDNRSYTKDLISINSHIEGYDRDTEAYLSVVKNIRYITVGGWLYDNLDKNFSSYHLQQLMFHCVYEIIMNRRNDWVGADRFITEHIGNYFPMMCNAYRYKVYDFADRAGIGDTDDEELLIVNSRFYLSSYREDFVHRIKQIDGLPECKFKQLDEKVYITK